MELPNKLDFLLAGVGGQGIVRSSDILAEVGLLLGYDVKKSEVHGMSQRGGAVNSHVRMARGGVLSPVIPKGWADVLIGLEKLEGARWLPYLREGGVVVLNDFQIRPSSLGWKGRYPSDEEILAAARRKTEQVFLFPATAIALEHGLARGANVALLGFVSSFLPLPEEAWLEAMAKHLPERFLEVNREIFRDARQRALAAQG